MVEFLLFMIKAGTALAVSHQEKAKEYVEEALQIIDQKLHDFTHEVEHNKLKAVERQKLIIEKR